MNGLSPEATRGLHDLVLNYQAAAGADCPKADAVYDELFPDQIDRFTFRQVFAKCQRLGRAALDDLPPAEEAAAPTRQPEVQRPTEEPGDQD